MTKKVRTLNPTLWRTCRMLAGETRLGLLRLLVERPGLSVAEYADEAGVGRSFASQELRRIQSRGLLKSSKDSGKTIYRLEADPQVPSAAPLLKALKKHMESQSAEEDAELARVVFGLAYHRRVSLLRALLSGPKSGIALSEEMGWSAFATYNHLSVLEASGWVRRENRHWAARVPAHPLGAVLNKLQRAEWDAE